MTISGKDIAIFIVAVLAPIAALLAVSVLCLLRKRRPSRTAVSQDEEQHPMGTANLLRPGVTADGEVMHPGIAVTLPQQPTSHDRGLSEDGSEKLAIFDSPNNTPAASNSQLLREPSRRSEKKADAAAV